MRRRDVLALGVAAAAMAMAMAAPGASASPGRRVGFVFVGAEGGWQIGGSGLSLLGAEYSAKWLGLLKTAAPSIARAGLVWNPESPVGRLEMKRVEAAAAALAMTVAPLSVQPAEVETSFAEIDDLKVDSLVVFDDALCGAYLQRIVELSAKRRLPTLYGFDEAVRLGGLMSYSTNFFEIWRRAGYHVARILQGARAAELPIEQATEIALRLNLKAAAQLGLDMPQSLLAAAAKVIE